MKKILFILTTGLILFTTTIFANNNATVGFELKVFNGQKVVAFCKEGKSVTIKNTETGDVYYITPEFNNKIFENVTITKKNKNGIIEDNPKEIEILKIIEGKKSTNNSTSMAEGGGGDLEQDCCKLCGTMIACGSCVWTECGSCCGYNWCCEYVQ